MGYLAELDEHQATMQALRPLAPEVERIAGLIAASLAASGTVVWFGNGGSAAQCQHLAAELVGRYEHERPALASVALTTDPALLTAVANDYSFDDVFSRQVDGLCRPGDVAIGLSTSGNSINVLRGIEAASARGATTVGMTGGDGGKLARTADAVLRVPVERISRIQEAHLFLGHLLCGLVERAASAGSGGGT